MQLERFDDVLIYPDYPNKQLGHSSDVKLGVPSLDLEDGMRFRKMIQRFQVTREPQELDILIEGEIYTLLIFEGDPPKNMVNVWIFDQDGNRLAGASETNFHRVLFETKGFGHFSTKAEEVLRGTGAAGLVRTIIEAIFEVLPTEHSEGFSLAWFFIKMGYCPWVEYQEGNKRVELDKIGLRTLINLAAECRKGDIEALEKFPTLQLVYNPKWAFMLYQKVLERCATQ